MSASVLEVAPPETEPSPAELQWAKTRAALTRKGIQVLVAKTYDLRDRAGSVHILALTDVRAGRGRAGRDVFIPGLDVQYTPFPAESAFCGAPSTVRKLAFRITLSRHEEPKVGAPTCKRCLRVCESLTSSKPRRHRTRTAVR